MRETIEAKAHRYLAEGRLTIHSVRKRSVTATAKGDGADYSVTYRRGRWSCDCPARGRCCHQVAARLVTAPQRPGRLRRALYLVLPGRRPWTTPAVGTAVTADAAVESSSTVTSTSEVSA